jgi:muconolactone delta-isomerase
MFAMLVTCAALTLVVMSLAVPRELEARRLARLRAAQEKWARELDRRW